MRNTHFIAAIISSLCAVSALNSDASASRQIYRIPPPQLDLEHVPEAATRLDAPRFIRIWNSLNEGPYAARVLELHPDIHGRFSVSADRRVSLLQNLYPNDMARNICEVLITSDVATRFGHSALNAMASRGQFGLPTTAQETYQESIGRAGLAVDGNQVFLESVSWFTASELRLAFPSEFPWAFVAEVEAPGNLDADQVRALVLQGEPEVRVLLRRALLRVVSSFGLPSADQNARHLAPLPMPFEIDPLWQGLSLPANGNHLFGVEWGRAAQLRAFPGDSETLARIASVISMHFLALHGRLTGRNSVVYVQSARPANTRLYQEGLSLNLLANQNGLSLLGNPLDEVIGRIKPEESLLGLARLRELFPEVHSESLIRWLIGLAEGVRLDFDLYEHNGVNWLSRMPLGPVILRDLSPFARERIREMVRPLEREWSPHRSEELVDFVMSHLRHSSLRDPFYFRDDFPRVATEWENGISPIVVSNLETQPDVKAILRIIYDKYLRGMGNSSHFPTVEIAVVTRNDSVAIELLGTGLFREISPSGRVRRFLARLSTLSQLSVNQQYQLRDGYWMRNRLLHELPGL